MMVAIQIRLRICQRKLIAGHARQLCRLVAVLCLLFSAAACATDAPERTRTPSVSAATDTTAPLPVLAAARPALTVADANRDLATAANPQLTATTARGSSAAASDCVVLLHGLARSAKSMRTLQALLESLGYHVANTGYPSRKAPVAELALEALPRALDHCDSLAERQPQLTRGGDASVINTESDGSNESDTGVSNAGGAKIHFVTHSMGGILLRYYLSRHDLPTLGRVVMLAPPNQGSQVVDKFGSLPGFQLLNGPAGLQLGTGADSVPRQLGAVSVDLGVIAGTRSINLILSQVLPNPDDGKVSVANTRLEGMCAHLALPVSHPFIMQRQLVLDEVVHFLDTGRFLSEAAEYLDCPARATP